jgi:hypothetical protein
VSSTWGACSSLPESIYCDKNSTAGTVEDCPGLDVVTAFVVADSGIVKLGQLNNNRVIRCWESRTESCHSGRLGEEAIGLH